MDLKLLYKSEFKALYNYSDFSSCYPENLNMIQNNTAHRQIFKETLILVSTRDLTIASIVFVHEQK